MKGVASRPAARLEPTPQQRAIEQSPQRLVIVEANAGAAKTTTLALRIRAELERGTEPAQVLALTYTRAGCEALGGALAAVGLPKPLRARLPVQTFDEFAAARLLPSEGRVPFLDSRERLRPHLAEALRRAAAAGTDGREGADAAAALPDAADADALLAEFLQIKGTMALADAGDGFRLTDASAWDAIGRDRTTVAAFKAFERWRLSPRSTDSTAPRLRSAGDPTYDLALLLTADDPSFGWDDHPLALALALRLVVVDEMHDLNRAMFTVLQHLLARNGAAHFAGVGDRDQVLHAEAGADAQWMGAGFDAHIGTATRYPLTGSFRFGPRIAAVMAAFAGKPYAVQGTRETVVEVQAAASAADVALHIRGARDRRAALAMRQPLDRLAVLLRRPEGSMELENALLDRGVEYKTAGFDSYLVRRELLFARGLLAYALDDFAAIELPETRQRIVRALLLFCGASIVTRIDGVDEDQLRREEDAARELAALPQRFSGFVEQQLLPRAAQPARALIEAALPWARSDDVADLPRFVAALDAQRIAAGVLVRRASIEAVGHNIAGLVRSVDTDSVRDFLHRLNARELQLRANLKKQCITLSTIEDAKGREFDHVIVPFVDAGQFDGPAGRSADDRNLFYVAATRARERLTLLHDAAAPSAYLREAGLLG